MFRTNPNKTPHVTFAGALLAFVLPAFAAPSPAPASSATTITINADRSSALSPPHGNHSKVIYSGHVVIHRGILTLHGERAIIHLLKQKIERIVVTGQPTRFTVKPEGKPVIHGHAASVTYEADTDSLQLDGNVYVMRPGQSFTASHVDYNLKSRLLKARSKAGGQVHAVLTPAGGSSP